MSQLTLRGFDKKLEQRIQQLAKQENISLNKAALHLMRRGSGLDRETTDPHVIGDQLDDFIGSWSVAQAADFDKAVAVFEQVDVEHWQ